VQASAANRSGSRSINCRIVAPIILLFNPLNDGKGRVYFQIK